MRQLFYSTFLMLIAFNLYSQPVRYLDKYYTSIEVSYDHVYAENATILYLDPLGEAIREPLFFDLYKPPKDDSTCNGGLRPLIIFFHSGNFIPFPYNQSPVGTKRDSSVVEMCRRIASTGYVVASADYRLGWNPFALPEEIARLGIINAAYRGVQDANTCVRYFKKSVVEDGNPFGIDTSQIVLFGDDTGGYLAINSGCLDSYNKIPTASKGKFLIHTPDTLHPIIPMIIQDINGDPEGKQIGVMNSDYADIFPYPVGDTLCYSNYPEYSSSFKAAVSMGGAVADSAWMEPGQPPIICIHAPYDQTTPCGEDYVRVGDQRIVEVQGSRIVSDLANQYGNNACLEPPHYSNDFERSVTDVADSRSGGVDNLYLVLGDTITDGTPWNFWDCNTNPNCEAGLKDNPHMSREKAERYIDTILAFVLPRLYQCMDLCIVATNDPIDPNEINIITYPNPSFNEVFIGTAIDHPIRSIRVYDMKGSLVNQFSNINSNYFHLSVDKLIPGLYVLKFQFDEGIAARQIVVK
ncbi:MAG: T9SS type A sorting domain-containing protein [Saprospiraceae bacterium]